MSIKGDVGEFMVETAKKIGVSCATVSDGHLLIFTKEKLQEILAAADPNSALIVVHIKRPDFNS